MQRHWRFAVLGDPISHSKSPAIHTGALRLAGLEGSYEAIRADAQKLNHVVGQMSEGLYDGLNITMPLKEDAALLAGSPGPVNTLRARDGEIQAISTDQTAFSALLSLPSVSLMGSVLLLGTGGSARSFLPVLGERQVYLSGRNQQAVRDLCESYPNAEPVRWGTAVVGALVVNATPVGMSGDALPNSVIDAAGGLIDLPYGSQPTPAIRVALHKGLVAVDGFEFLARQAAASFEWWTDVPVDSNRLVELARNV